MSGELAGCALLLALFVVAVIGHNAGSIRAWFNRPGISLDHWDGVMRPLCSVAFCDEPVQVHLAVGHNDSWPFCIGHGIPYLTEDLAS